MAIPDCVALGVMSAPSARPSAFDQSRSLKTASMTVGSRWKPPIGLVETTELQRDQSRCSIAYHAAARLAVKTVRRIPVTPCTLDHFRKIQLGTDFGKAPADINPHRAWKRELLIQPSFLGIPEMDDRIAHLQPFTAAFAAYTATLSVRSAGNEIR